MGGEGRAKPSQRSLAEQETEVGAGPTGVKTPRHLQIGTIAIIRKMLDPSEVGAILSAQRSAPDRRFGELAVELGLLTNSQVEELLEEQRKVVFTDAELLEARTQIAEMQGIAEELSHILASVIGCLTAITPDVPPESPTTDQLHAAVRLAERGVGLSRHLLTFCQHTATDAH
jgi:hypothetical protein